jgi:hypothetical protein
MRSTTFLFITQCTSVQILGEKLSRSRLSQHILRWARRRVATRQSARALAVSPRASAAPLAFEPTGRIPRPPLPQATRTLRQLGFRARPDRVAALPAGPLPPPPCVSAPINVWPAYTRL